MRAAEDDVFDPDLLEAIEEGFALELNLASVLVRPEIEDIGRMFGAVDRNAGLSWPLKRQIGQLLTQPLAGAEEGEREDQRLPENQSAHDRPLFAAWPYQANSELL